MENLQTFSAGDSHVKVLVVDDHPNTAKMLARAISRLSPNVDVVFATNGHEALKYSNDGAADILITDMMMPEMTGVELIKALNDQPSTSPAVSFILTAYDSLELREVAQSIHVKQVIAKPVHPEWICQLILQTMNELKQARSVGSEPVPTQVQMEAPGVETEYEVLNIEQLLWEVAREFQPQADEKNQFLVVGKTEPNSRVRGNAMQLRQALCTLISSAIQGTIKGGSVIFSSEVVSEKVNIQIKGTGGGNDEPNNNESLDQDMATIKAIASQHGGDVTFAGETEKGSSFIMCLPIHSMDGFEKNSTNDNFVSPLIRR